MRIQLLGVAAALSLAVALSGCSSGATHAAIGVATGTSSPSPGPAVPSSDQLKSALLTANDLGPSFSVQPSDSASPTNDTGLASGCSELTQLMNQTAPPSSSSGPSQGEDQQVILTGGQTGPFVGEFLSSRPSTVLDQHYPTAVNALKTCKELNIPTGSTTIAFKLGDVDFGSPGSVAKHMTASVQGVPVNGYLAIDRLSPTVAFVYLYIQVAGDNPQAATGYYHQAITKADSVLGLTTPSQAA
ncbi:hypothetical protein [Streptacidiphilus rugosus]|uniref:hypothetical protein n=1 Tax=Streptacidiphilus rugosus TaxID=405783 RepID=UPI0012FB345F|nr:hypothetical protein [Streptacidiphilus rugosus]